MSLLMDQKHTLSPVHWIASHNLLPHCKNAKSLSALRSGTSVTIKELL